MKRNYCKNDPSKCARYMVFKALRNVPIDLYPDEIEKAKEILKEGKLQVKNISPLANSIFF